MIRVRLGHVGVLPRCLAAAALVVVSGCTADRSSPSGPSNGGPSATLTGRALDALSGQALPGVGIRVVGVGETTTAGDGTFTLAAPGPEEIRAASVTSSSTVERTTLIRAPGPPTDLLLIPSSFDLGSFDQMARGNGALHRWMAPPPVVILRRVLRFTTADERSYAGGAAVMSDEEVQTLFDDLLWALPQLTGGTFGAFAERRVELRGEGESETVVRPGSIVIARYDGMQAATGAVGFGRWSWNSSGVLQSAVVMLDAGYDSSARSVRRAVRAHELGHALGYNHVEGRASVMNSPSTGEITGFDRDVARITFLRRPLNQSPDADAHPFTVNSDADVVSWAAAPQRPR